MESSWCRRPQCPNHRTRGWNRQGWLYCADHCAEFGWLHEDTQSSHGLVSSNPPPERGLAPVPMHSTANGSPSVSFPAPVGSSSLASVPAASGGGALAPAVNFVSPSKNPPLPRSSLSRPGWKRTGSRIPVPQASVASVSLCPPAVHPAGSSEVKFVNAVKVAFPRRPDLCPPPFVPRAPPVTDRNCPDSESDQSDSASESASEFCQRSPRAPPVTDRNCPDSLAAQSDSATESDSESGQTAAEAESDGVTESDSGKRRARKRKSPSAWPTPTSSCSSEEGSDSHVRGDDGRAPGPAPPARSVRGWMGWAGRRASVRAYRVRAFHCFRQLTEELLQQEMHQQETQVQRVVESYWSNVPEGRLPDASR
jgi:hypothetical protein